MPIFELDPVYTYEEVIELIPSLSTITDFEILRKSINEDIKNYTAYHYLLMTNEINQRVKILDDKKLKETIDFLKNTPKRSWSEAELEEQRSKFEQIIPKKNGKGKSRKS